MNTVSRRVPFVCINLALAVAATGGVASAQTFTNPSSTSTTTNGTSATAASPYPSTITVPVNVTGTVATISVVLHGVTATAGQRSGLAFAGLVLIAPSGKSLEILGGVGDGNDAVSGLNITFSDSGVLPPNNVASMIPATGSVTWKPSSYGIGGSPEPHS